jgi:hypothetical protein
MDLIEEAVVAFVGFKRRDWLSWGARIMPAYAVTAVEEEREEAGRLAEEERARAAAEVEQDRKMAEAKEAQTLAHKTFEINEEAKAQRRAVAQDFIEKKIDREESNRRAAQIETARLQRLSVVAGESKNVEGGGRPMTQESSSSSLQAPKAPSKRKSDDNLAGLLEVTGKVSTYDLILILVDIGP